MSEICIVVLTVVNLAQLPATLLHVDLSGNSLTRLDGLETVTSLRWLNASRNALKASTRPAAPHRVVDGHRLPTCLLTEGTPM
jgi:hypothetical protein